MLCTYSEPSTLQPFVNSPILSLQFSAGPELFEKPRIEDVRGRMCTETVRGRC